MSFGTWIAIGVVFFITYAVSDWLADKSIKLIKKFIAKRREKKLVKGVTPQGTGKTLAVTQRMKDFQVLPDEPIVPVDNLFCDDFVSDKD